MIQIPCVTTDSEYDVHGDNPPGSAYRPLSLDGGVSVICPFVGIWIIVIIVRANRTNTSVPLAGQPIGFRRCDMVNRDVESSDRNHQQQQRQKLWWSVVWVRNDASRWLSWSAIAGGNRGWCSRHFPTMNGIRIIPKRIPANTSSIWLAGNPSLGTFPRHSRRPNTLISPDFLFVGKQIIPVASTGSESAGMNSRVAWWKAFATLSLNRSADRVSSGTV